MPWVDVLPEHQQDPVWHHRFPYAVIVAEARRYFVAYGRWPNVYEPKTYSEKVFWRKLFDRNPLLVDMTDKLAARSIAESLGYGRLLKTVIATYDGTEQLAARLSQHTGWLHMSNASRRNARIGGDCGVPSNDVLHFWRSNVFGYSTMEWAYYPNAPRNKFILEPWLGDIFDIKVFCFSGAPQFAYIARENPTRVAFVALDGTPLKLRNRYPILRDYEFALKHLDEAIDAARVLSSGVDHIRVDFVVSTDGLRFGEFTAYPSSGMNPFLGADAEIGEMWNLSDTHAVPYLPRTTPYV